MKKMFLGVATVAVTALASTPTINHTTLTSQAVETANSVEFSIQAMSGSMSFPYKKRGDAFMNNIQRPLELLYSAHAKNWDDFVAKFPNFKFNKLILKTNFKGDVQTKDLSNVVYNTADFKLKELNKQFTLTKIESKYVTDSVRLSVISHVESDKILFGILYGLNITGDYYPNPTIEAITDKIQFFTAT